MMRRVKVKESDYRALISRYCKCYYDYEKRNIHVAYHKDRNNLFIFRSRTNKPLGSLWVIPGSYFVPEPLPKMKFLTKTEFREDIDKCEIFYEVIAVPDGEEDYSEIVI